MNDPHDFLIRHKCDSENTHKLIEMGYPAVAPVLSHMMEWIQDMNWPVAIALGPFLASIGEPIVPEVRNVLATNDYEWKYSVVDTIVSQSDAVATAVKPDLMLLAEDETDRGGLSELAQQVLDQLSDSDPA